MDIKESRFTVLNFLAELEFHTASSASYRCERYSASLCPRRQLGWIDVHWPCENHHVAVELRIALPEEYHSLEKLEEIRRSVFRALGIPEDAPWESECFEQHAIIGTSDGSTTFT
jgi:hypothetical protein